MRHLTALSLALSIAACVHAQVGVSYISPAGPYIGAYPGPYFGYFPGAYRGFYSNGYSLYGPPVPTYGAVPGVFGGADQRLDTFPDIRYRFYGPYGWRGYYTPINAGPMSATQQFVVERSTAVCEVILPSSDATVTLNGKPWEATGTTRRFTTPVAFNGTIVYEIEANWTDDRGIAASRRSVVLRPGETVVTDFTKP